MSYQAAKTFDRLGTRYRPGDPLPTDLDKATLDHYQRHGMLREPQAPAETKPASPRRTRTPAAPKDAKPAAPQSTAAADAASAVPPQELLQTQEPLDPADIEA